MRFDPSKATTSAEPCHQRKHHHSINQQEEQYGDNAEDNEQHIVSESSPRRTPPIKKAQSADHRIPSPKHSLLITITLILVTFLTFSLVSYSRQSSSDGFVPQPHRTASQPNNREQRKSVYSGSPTSDGRVWSIDRHWFRRRRSLSGVHSKREKGVWGLALHCGHHCVLRLKSEEKGGDDDLRVRFTRWKPIPKPQNKTLHNLEGKYVIPLVQFIDSEEEMHARLPRMSPKCLYSAHIKGVPESSIVNLCDSHGGMFGTLALPNGTYMIEPVTGETSDKGQHLVFRFRSHNFHAPAGENSTEHHAHRDKSHIKHKNDSTPVYAPDSNEWVDITSRKTRARRSANSWDHYVEVLVVADYKMLVYHQGNLENYILTLFSTVASIYRHPSLKAAINIIVVKIIILKHERAGPMISNRAQETLQNFCQWQQNYNDRNDDAPNHHDVAILLTRHDICRAKDKCDTLGLAELGTMCDPMKSCAIIEDNGLSAAFTIAHELGHIFNIPHDDEKKCGYYMTLNKHNYHIMAPTLEYNTHPWSWSACSSAMLAKFLDNYRSQTQCILDQPVERRYYEKMFENPAPGVTYSVNQQCQFVFGPSAELCPYMPSCRRLWCSTYYGYQMGCRTQHMPWADGTPCGDNQWCHRGQCVGMSPQQREKQDGAWGEWKPWGVCSRTCGGGVQKALRDCDSPRPSNGGKYCVGQRERYRPCNIQDCPWDTPGFREVQCAEFDNQDVGIHGVPKETRWVPKYSGVSQNERCKLYCRSSNSAAFYLLKDKVADGTPCDRNSDDICIDGTCHSAGCDHRLGSDMQRDRCGICGGDGSTCRTVSGVYNERGSYGYNEVLKIPAGSANIDITQHGYNNNKEDDNYLALRSANGEFLLNGHFQVSIFRQQIPIQDTVLEYSGSDHVVERINGTGPIRSDVYLHVLSVGNMRPPDIRYEFMVPVAKSPKQSYLSASPSTYYWRHSDRWTDCSSSCKGSQSLQVICVDAVSGRPTHDHYCTGRKPQPTTRMCNIECELRWVSTPSSSCSASCGHGQQHHTVVCVKKQNYGNREEVVHESYCDQSKKPKNVSACYSHCSGFKWSYSEWNACSETCGTSGTSRRNFYCVDSYNRKADTRSCESLPREQTEMECNRIPCPQWVYGHWSECSRSCDGGVRVRMAQCQDAAGRDQDPSRCDASKRLVREQCNEHMCTQWRFGSWSTCSTTCGTGVQTREAHCVKRDGQPIDQAHCDPRERIVQKSCENAACPEWRVGSWSPCSVSCLDGWSTRRVACVNSNGHEVSDADCLANGEAKPASHQTCNHGMCPFWRTSEWSACSVSCGTGHRERTVECIYRDGVVDNSLCGDSSPANVDRCSLLPCAMWEPDNWSSCSVTCGSGVQNREVHCKRGKTKAHDSECDARSKPKTVKPCEREECGGIIARLTSSSDVSPFHWAMGPWTDCSQPCGSGTQRRLVVCRDHVRDLPEEYCRHLEKEESTRSCNERPCAEWVVGEWHQCSATCGEHVVQERKVTCEPTIRGTEEVLETDCDPAMKPDTMRSCGLHPCPSGQQPAVGSWISDEWSKCTVTCGGGWRRRVVKCSSETCIEDEKPDEFERCNSDNCKTAMWQISPWSHCSVTCGSGEQRRSVWCESDVEQRIRVNDSECAVSEQPPSRRECTYPSCSSLALERTSRGPSSNVSGGGYRWHSDKWSACSAACGKGQRTRKVTCVDSRGSAVAENHCQDIKKPLTRHRCRMAHCPRWRTTKWSMCSATCGQGVRTRAVTCRRGRKHRVPDAECLTHARRKKPTETAPCSMKACPAYHWQVTPWSKCIDSCKKTDQHRRVYCMNNQDKRAAPRMCANTSMPITSKPCDISKCPYHWVPGPWSTCSKTCGKGYQFRRIECRVKSASNSSSGTEPSVQARMCISLVKPNVSKECAMNACNATYHWSAGPWSQCSASCGPGFRRRRVSCLDRNGQRVSRNKCAGNPGRPRRRESCFLRNCLPGDCAELKAYNTITNSMDGNYTVLVAGYRISVYCHLMNETIPKTFINVNTDSNYAEIYGKRLLYPFTCPHKGFRNDSCECSDDGNRNAGLSRYSKLRVDLHNMKINIHDHTFADKVYGEMVPYATAGDCYSAAECPQGVFSADLRGTGLRIVDDLQWVDQGHRTYSRIERKFNNALIMGRCGGYCGQCSPDRFKGLVIEVDQKQKPSIGIG
uniref:Peptidase M12B domain-containing protein n=1 Tax=Steinernema glaseri TaxID=37863 RepID=A0A1I7YLD8_9BILA